MENKRTIGSRYEEIAAAFLTGQGVRILERNYRNRTGEIDLIGREGNSRIFVEVKGRRSDRQGDPAEAVTPAKQERIRRTALWYLMKQGLPADTPCRFDVIAILGTEIRWIRNAF